PAPPPGRIGAAPLAQPLLALERVGAEPVRAVAFGDAPLHAVVVGDDLRHARPVLLVDPSGPEIVGLVGMAIRGDHEILPRIPGARGAGPAPCPGGVEPPAIGLVDDDIGRDGGSSGHDAILLHCTSVNGGVASSW